MNNAKFMTGGYSGGNASLNFVNAKVGNVL